jgi:hypothetical protein
MHQYTQDSIDYQRTPRINNNSANTLDSSNSLDSLLSTYIKDMQKYDMGMVFVGNDGNTYSHQSDNQNNHANQAYHMEQVVGKYLCSKDGEDFVRYVTHDRGKQFVEIKGIGAGDLGESTVAAILMNDTEGILLANYNGVPFEDRVNQMAKLYDLDSDSMRDYVITHELAHAAGHRTEESCERFVKEFYHHQAQNAPTLEQTTEYLQLADVAEQRENYARETGQ